MTATLRALRAGLVLTVLAAVVPFAAAGLLADHLRAGYPGYTPAQIGSAVATYQVVLSVVGGLGALLWLATILAVRAGRRWARATATVGLVLGVSVALTGLLIRDTSGDTGLPPALGWAGLVPCLAGVLAVAWLWTRPRPA
ncbi:hypothetical protein Amsp01_007430 [Amycolatopsis sp. NBRC 101858]|uniref:hypothetical protein n=1 Tax=Amycolatopsis sp. NBRC 101858 TaxID=3032200 RepID=UPI0024A29547|nr:hypothetical protein [Amycolatopsis sp. NBRC 101858]GLY34719.1 hypothetical protein Amsp01_007430 [Amycolatopsis sp. NBRC 101858]